MAYSTLEGKGPNKLGTTSGNCRDLGFTSMTDNATTSPSTSYPKASNPGQKLGSPLVNEVIKTNDTQMIEVPSGTIEATLDVWSR